MLRTASGKTDIKAIFILIAWGAKHGKVLPRSQKEVRESIANFFVWEEKNVIVGCCSLEVYNKKLSEIRSLVVLSNYQKKGIGRKLVLACLKKAKNLGIYEVLSVTDKDSFFEKLGFSKCLNNQWPMFIKP